MRLISKINDNCYKLLKEIPLGKITTYKILAEKLSSKGYRAIGKIVGSNPNPISVPCHRVVKSNGEIGGYIFGTEKKIEILNKEGIEVINDKIKNFENLIYKF